MQLTLRLVPTEVREQQCDPNTPTGRSRRGEGRGGDRKQKWCHKSSNSPWSREVLEKEVPSMGSWSCLCNNPIGIFGLFMSSGRKGKALGRD